MLQPAPIIKKISEKNIIEIPTYIGKTNILLAVSSKYQLSISRENLHFKSRNISIFELAAFLLSSISGQLKREYILKDEHAVYTINNEEENIGDIRVLKGKNSADLNKFHLCHYPIKITCRTSNPELFIKYKLSMIDTINLLGQLSKIRYHAYYYTIDEINIIRHENKIEFKIGGSESAFLDKQNILIFLKALKRWLSGQYLIDERAIKSAKSIKDNKQRPYYTCRYNREGLGFNGMPIPMVNIHGMSQKLSYLKIAELYYVVKCMNNFIV